jgi:hypothetical protein
VTRPPRGLGSQRRRQRQWRSGEALNKVSGPFPHRVTSGGGRRVSAAMRKGNRRSAGHMKRLLDACTEPVVDTVGEASADDFWLVGEGVW